MVQRKVGKRTCFREQRCEVDVGLRIPFKKNNNIETTRLDVRRQTKENNLDLRHGMPQERNIETKMNNKRTKYQLLAFEIRERRKEYKVVVVPIIIGCLGGGIDKTIREVRQIFENDELAKQIVGTMQKTALMDSEATLRKIFSGLIQLEES